MTAETSTFKRKNDPRFRLWDNIRILVQMAMERNGGKRGRELLRNCLPFTNHELIAHMEKLFEPWMNWQNYIQRGRNAKTWNDNDPTTWTWCLDHVEPHHSFKYTSLQDQLFIRCWTLNNLIPVSIKQKPINNHQKKSKLTEKACKICHETKDINCFPLKKDHDGVFRYRRNCIDCLKTKKTFLNKKYREDHKEELQKANRQWYQEHKEEMKKSSAEHKKKNKAKRNANAKERRKNDPAFVLRANISSAIWKALKINKGSKKRKSIKDYLPYTIEELKIHLENQFEDWMTWRNHGKYDAKTWNDKDKSTWTWNIDHKIAQAKLPFASMEDPNFLICWELDNLQPLNAKDNIIKGARLTKPAKVKTK